MSNRHVATPSLEPTGNRDGAAAGDPFSLLFLLLVLEPRLQVKRIWEQSSLVGDEVDDEIRGAIVGEDEEAPLGRTLGGRSAGRVTVLQGTQISRWST